tara:strand:- start:1474 stop:2202 length:729 start_codon:yes stop_codon:yes gene_type:complete
MLEDEYQRMYDFEENYWWFKGKRHLLKTFFLKYYRGRPKVLDIGCGTGIVMKEFKKVCDISGVDFSKEAITFCKNRGLVKVKEGDAMDLPYDSNSFEAVFILDVMYHKWILNDVKVMKEIHRVLKKNGEVFITDSAFPMLWGKHDVASQAARRYTKKDLQQKLELAGFEIEKISYFNFFLFPLVFIMRKLSNLLSGAPKTDLKPLPGFINGALYGLLKIETMMVSLISLPFGVSIFCVARKI